MALVIVAGGSRQHAAVVYEAALLSNIAISGFVTLDADPGAKLFDCRWLGQVETAVDQGIGRDSPFIVACGDNSLRRKISEYVMAQGLGLATITHPAAIVSPSADVGPGTVVLAGAIIGPRARLGCGVIVNHAASIDHDCEVADFANICPGARLAGTVRCGPAAFVGMNASILQGLQLGEAAIVGAGAVVTKDVLPAQTVVGVPARPVRSV